MLIAETKRVTLVCQKSGCGVEVSCQLLRLPTLACPRCGESWEHVRPLLDKVLCHASSEVTTVQVHLS